MNNWKYKIDNEIEVQKERGNVVDFYRREVLKTRMAISRLSAEKKTIKQPITNKCPKTSKKSCGA